MSKSHTFIILVLLTGFLFISQSAFIVKQGEQAMVLQFGKPEAQYTEPGLKFKTPFVQQVKFFPQMILSIDPDPEEVIMADQKRLVVDTFARYKIRDMLKFNNTLSNKDLAEAQLDNIINSTARAVLGSETLDDLLSVKRDAIMGKIRDEANDAVKEDKGVEIIDVRIIRADLPAETLEAVYKSMIAARQKEAAKYRGEGQSEAQATKSDADKQQTIILADANKQSQILRGEGEAAATRIYAEAFKRDPDFYAFYRTMQAYRESLSGDNTTMILSPEGDFFKYFKDAQGEPSGRK
jgi:modulator of FtsH protease HflC